LGRSGQRPELSQATAMALVRCILGKFLGVLCHCFPPRLDVPNFATRCPHVRHDARDPNGGRWNFGREYCPVIFPKWRLPLLLGIFYMPQIYDMGPTALFPLRRKACWGIFSPLKVRRLRPGLNPRTWVLKASTLPLDHRCSVLIRPMQVHNPHNQILWTNLRFFVIWGFCRGINEFFGLLICHTSLIGGYILTFQDNFHGPTFKGQEDQDDRLKLKCGNVVCTETSVS
jgi:hypothetical protein